MKLSSSKNSGLLLMVVLIVALLFAIYYYVLLPKQSEASTIERSVNSLRSEISTLNEQIAFIQEDLVAEASNEFTLRKKLPNNREIDELLLNIEQIEYVSGTRIQGIGFNNYDSLVSASSLTDPNAVTETEENAEGQKEETKQENKEQNKDQTTSSEEQRTEQETTAPVTTIAVESLPANLKLITFNVDVDSPNHQNLQQFIKEIEKLERVMHIDTVDYTLPGEENTFKEDASDIVAASIQITTFYYE